VRILFTFAGGSGHLDPLVPIAHAAEAACHTVAFTGRPWMVPAVRAAGFTAFATGSDVGGKPTGRLPLRELDAQREEQEFREGFARRITRERATPILALCAEWRPDLLVCEDTDFGGMLAAERFGVPYATVVVLAAGSLMRKALIAEPLDELRAEFGLPPDPDLAMLSRYLVLSPVPPSYRDPAFPLPATAHTIRPLAREFAGDDAAPPWLADLPEAPTVYFTLGTVFNTESGDLFSRVLTGLRDLPINLIVTVGSNVDPAEFEPRPANVHIERYIPQSLVLSRCDAVVSHGGSGRVVGALAYGRPMVLIPMGADQPANAARCAELGVARVLDAVSATPENVCEAVSAVLAQPAYQQAAERIGAEIAALPGPTHAVELLEQLSLVEANR
jgi:UDP:flavonoid glycosyltransferase YjiC (YdhE family)